MFRFVEFHYINAIYLYRRIDGYGERISASAASILYSTGLWLLALNIFKRFAASLMPLWQQWVPVIYKPKVAELLLLAALSMIVSYFWLWRRTPLLEERYSVLKTQNRRWLAAFGFLMSVGFFLASGYGLINFPLSLVFVSSSLILQELLYVFLKNRFEKQEMSHACRNSVID